MKKINDIPDIVKEVNSNFPDGAIINETETNDGTPVIREIYNDILVNLYRIMREVGLDSNGLEDNETNGYQIVEAIKKLPNLLNDIEQILSYDGNIYTTAFDFDYLPNKYQFIARVDSVFVAGKQIKGASATTYDLTSPTGFDASDEVLVILDQSAVRVYSLTKLGSETVSKDLSLALGSPLSYNGTSVLRYKEDGFVYSDLPTSVNLENSLRVFDSDGSIILLEVVFILGKCVAFCFSPDEKKYLSFQTEEDFSGIKEIVNSEFMADANDFYPNMYTDGANIYFTNQSNESASDNIITKYSYNNIIPSFTLVSTASIDPSFDKTTNAVLNPTNIYTLVGGILKSFSLDGTSVNVLGTYNSVIGNVFSFNGSFYFTSGEVAKKWVL